MRNLHIAIIAGILSIGTLFVSVAAAAPWEWETCRIGRVAAHSNRIHVRCVDGDFWYVARVADNDKEFINRVLALANTAVVTGNTVKIAYDPDEESGPDRFIKAFELFD